MRSSDHRSAALGRAIEGGLFLRCAVLGEQCPAFISRRASGRNSAGRCRVQVPVIVELERVADLKGLLRAAVFDDSDPFVKGTKCPADPEQAADLSCAHGRRSP
jgi:hypothetical protein